eukprot:1935758-Rhodomonas_salina.1
MMGSSSRRAATVSRDRTGAAASRAPRARSGSSAPGYRSRFAHLHSLCQPSMPFLSQPCLVAGNE